MSAFFSKWAWTNPDPDPIHKTSPKVNPVQHAEKGTRAKVLRDGKPLFVVLMKTIACLTNESRSNFGLSLEFLTTHSNLARWLCCLVENTSFFKRGSE